MKEWINDFNEINKEEAKRILTLKTRALSDTEIKKKLHELTINFNLEEAKELYFQLKPFDPTLYLAQNTDNLMLRTETLIEASSEFNILVKTENEFFIELLPTLPNKWNLKLDVTHYKKLSYENIITYLTKYYENKIANKNLNFMQVSEPENKNRTHFNKNEENEVKDKDEARGRVY